MLVLGSWLSIIFGGAIAAAALLFLVFKIAPMKKILAFDVFIDIAVTLGLAVALSGTFTGMMIALTAGAIVSIILFVMKKIIGSDKLTFKGWKPGRQPISIL